MLRRDLRLIAAIAAIPCALACAAQSRGQADITELVGIVASRPSPGADPMLSMLDAISSEISVASTLSALSRSYDANPAVLGGLSPASGAAEATLYNAMKLPPLMGAAGVFFRPVPGIITSPFGYRPRFRRMHKGIDLRLAVGDTVRAAFAGTVRSTGYDKNDYGYYMILTHDSGIETLYGHLSGFIATAGSPVRPGQAIALGGNTGRSTGPHLHFETRYQGYAVNPMQVCPDFSSTSPVSPQLPRDADPKKVLAVLQAAEFLLPAAAPEPGALKMQMRKGYGRPATYKARKGDTLISIARRFAMPPEALARLNSLPSIYSLVFAGQNILLK